MIWTQSQALEKVSQNQNLTTVIFFNFRSEIYAVYKSVAGTYEQNSNDNLSSSWPFKRLLS